MVKRHGGVAFWRLFGQQVLMRGALNNVARASGNTLTDMSGNTPLEISAVGKPL